MQARILPRVECPRSSLPPPPRLLFLSITLLQARRHVHHLPCQLDLPRARDELHHKEAARIRLPRHDAPAADYRHPEVEVLPPQNDSQRKPCFPCSSKNHLTTLNFIECLLLAFDDFRSFLGKAIPP